MKHAPARRSVVEAEAGVSSFAPSTGSSLCLLLVSMVLSCLQTSSACLPLPTSSSSVDLDLLLLQLSSSAPFFPRDPSTARCFSLSLLNIRSLTALPLLLCHSLCTPAPTPTSSPQKAGMVDVRHRKSSVSRDSSLRRGGGGSRRAGIVGGEVQTQGHMKEGGNDGS